MATTSYISEFESRTLECKPSSILFPETNSYAEANRAMAPQQVAHQEGGQKTSDKTVGYDQSREDPDSSVSSPESSSPPLQAETITANANQSSPIGGSQIIDAFSTDSASIPNGISEYRGDHEKSQNPLEQLQCSLEENGTLGKKLNLSSYDQQQSGSNILNRNSTSISGSEESCVYYEGDEIFKCHLCKYTGSSQEDYNTHMNSHFDHKCPYCDYTSRTEGRLKRHVKQFHASKPPESWTGSLVPRTDRSAGEQSMDDSVSSSGNGKTRVTKCKQCDFTAESKNVYWDHLRVHINLEKCLYCPQCNFITEYKHHLQYHLRNHYNSKPFQCTKCNYHCVNKSMLNSHMKSHSNIYQYHCADCTYATKYCHSLKLHLRKYQHNPSMILNSDGTPNPTPVIDVYGTRRGPRAKKRKMMEDSENNPVSSSITAPPSQQSISFPATPLLPPNIPVMYHHTQLFNNYHDNAYMRQSSSTNPCASSTISPTLPCYEVSLNNHFKCPLCNFVTDMQDQIKKHMIMHAPDQNIMKVIGINPNSSLHMQNTQIVLNNYMQRQQHYMRLETNNFKVHDIENSSGISGHSQPAHEMQNARSEREKHNSSGCAENNTLSSRSNTNDSRNEFYSTAYRNSADSTSQKLRQDEQLREIDESVIVMHKPPSSVQSKQQIDKATETIYVDNDEATVAEHSPLDLSSAKVPVAKTGREKNKDHEISRESQNIKMKTNSVSETGKPMSSSQCPTRNRRKGKAFKIDQYVAYDDNALPEEFQKKSDDLGKHNEFYINVKSSSYEERENIRPVRTSVDRPLINSYQNPRKFLSPETYSSSKRIKIAVPDIASASHFQNTAQRQSCLSPFTRNGFNPTGKKARVQSPKDANPTNEYEAFPAITAVVPKVEIDVEKEASTNTLTYSEVFECSHCDMTFRDCTMHTIHMGYHDFDNPYTCNMCGQKCKNKIEFFLHIARKAHL